MSGDSKKVSWVRTSYLRIKPFCQKYIFKLLYSCPASVGIAIGSMPIHAFPLPMRRGENTVLGYFSFIVWKDTYPQRTSRISASGRRFEKNAGAIVTRSSTVYWHKFVVGRRRRKKD